MDNGGLFSHNLFYGRSVSSFNIKAKKIKIQINLTDIKIENEPNPDLEDLNRSVIKRTFIIIDKLPSLEGYEINLEEIPAKGRYFGV